MLQRAASNAYSWWWASHVRTKQSKWLEQSLQDMGDKVESVLKLITQDGDSFAKRAEMYYKHRPELISFVEESFRAYQSLAERYDHISKELQNANSTLASAFPDQYQFPMDEDDDYSPRVPRKFQMTGPPNPNIPTAPVPKFPTKNIKAIMALTSKNNVPKSAPKSKGKANKVPKSGLTKTQATDEIDKLQKKILTLQTEKEFAKSSYENGYNKYWNIEEEIEGMQQNISKLQDEFQIAQSIDDNEARTLMAEAAIKSCQDTLAQLQEKQEKATAEAKAERQRIKDARDRLRSFKSKLTPENQIDASESGDSIKAEEISISFEDEAECLGEPKELEMLRDKIKEHFDVGASSSLTVSEMAEKIDELVNKVISLETAVSSQTALIHRLRSEADELQSHVKILEEDKTNLMEGKDDLSGKVCEMENKLKGLQELDRSFRQQSSSLETHFSEARSNLDTMSKKLCDVTPDEEVEEPIPSFGKGGITADVDVETETVQNIKETDVITSKTKESSLEVCKQKNLEVDPPQEVPSTTQEQEESVTLPILEPFTVEDNTPQMTPLSNPEYEPVTTTHNDEPINPQGSQQEPATLPILQPVVPQEVPENVSLVGKPNYDVLDIQQKDGPPSSPQSQVQRRKEEGEPDWQQLFTNGLEGKEKVLLQEYTSTLRNYKEAKKQLNEMEKKSQEDLSEIEAQLKEMKNYNAMKDEEIQTLRQKLHLLQKRFDEHKNSKEEKEVATPVRNEEPEEYEDLGVPAIPEREISPVEQKLRADIDEILEENLDFWMRFSSSFGQIQKFQNGVQDLFSELAKLEKDREKKDGSTHGSTHGSSHESALINLKSDVRPIYKHLREIETELTVWLEQSEKLKEELQRRFTQLCNIQEEINHAVNAGAEDDEMIFTSYQAAKFQGELANMQQENHKVADELQAGMDHITSLQVDVERTITRLNEDLGLSGSKSQNEDQASENKARVPLRSFIFGVKPQKKKQSIFSCMHPAMMQRRYQHLRADKSE